MVGGRRFSSLPVLLPLAVLLPPSPSAAAFVTSRSHPRHRDANWCCIFSGKRTHHRHQNLPPLATTSRRHLGGRRPSRTALHLAPDPSLFDMTATSSNLLAWDPLGALTTVDKDAAEALAGPFFGVSLFPYLAFLFFLSRKETACPKGVTVGFATCLLFVLLTIPAAIAAKLLYGVSLADCDWLHGSAESMLTITNLVTVVPFRQALAAKERGVALPNTATSYAPTVWLVVGLTALATATVAAPALTDPVAHTPYLGGFLDLPAGMEAFGAHPEPDNALTVGTWIIHVSSLVEFLVAMGFCWRWADVANNPRWKGLTWGLLPLHSSGITACVSHVFYNRIALLVPLQALLTCAGNATAACAAYRIAVSEGWKPGSNLPDFFKVRWLDLPAAEVDAPAVEAKGESKSLVGFEDLGEALAGDNDYTFLLKLFVGCTVFSYVIKYGETFFDFPFTANLGGAITLIAVPSALNAYKWYRRSKDPTFEGWF